MWTHLNQEAKIADQVSSRIGLLERGIGKTQSHLEDKTQLKSKFKKIQKYYISQRESLGWAVSAVKKEELQVHVRNHWKI